MRADLRWPILLLGCALCALASLAGAQGALDVSLLGASALDAQLGDCRARLNAELERKSALEAEVAGLPAAERALETALVRDVRALYRMRRGGLMSIAGGVDALIGHASRLAQLERMARRTLAELEAARARRAQLSDEERARAAAILALEQELHALEQARAQLAEQVAAERAAEQPPPEPAPSSARIGYGLSIVGADAESESFSAERGRLALPVAGASQIEPAERGDGPGRGLAFVAQVGASVRAAASGRVAFAGAYGSQGLAVIVEHGRKYQTLYGALESVDVQPGDAISKSARIGAAGSAPVYFEVRRGRRTQDARSWLGL